jgi:hypothetical protein
VEPRHADFLPLAQGYGPDEACAKAGAILFEEKFNAVLNPECIWRALLRIGTRSWCDRIATKEAAAAVDPAADAEPEKNDADEAFQWSPEAVARSMEANLRHCAHLLRRARWLALLSESTIAWQYTSRAAQTLRVIVLSEGQIIKRTHVASSPDITLPPGWNTPFGLRQANLDLGAYDRLRILTTEFRRVLGEGRRLTIRLNRHRNLHGEHVEQMLRWI